ncbi:MAG: phosphate ABC transporter permease subunit PstC, partial [Clostridia bacterium]|nr:phosphate ABC transporter permease subunit PstC [Clostridia bacterium]
ISATGPKGHVGSLVFIVGSISVSLFAVLLATPFALACAIFMAEISPRLGQRFLQPAIEIFVGIPSVVYGWVGYTLLCPVIAKVFRIPTGGEGLLAAGIVLALMIFPTVTTVSTDAIRSLPQEHKEASYALGSTRWQMIRKVRLPAASSGIFTGVVLGIARAFGEALAVSMVIGMDMNFPKSLLSRTMTLTNVIATSMGTASENSAWTASLWSMALLLFAISFVFIVIIRLIGRKKG